MTPTVPALPLVPEAMRNRILAAPRTVAAHEALMADMPALSVIETGGTASASTLPRDFTVAAWNVERCLFPDASAAHLAAKSPSIVLLSEMDSGMARTGQRNTTAEVAGALGMAYAYGVEFFEMGLGGQTELTVASDDFNAAGWHGNAVLTRVPPERVALIRLPEAGYWFAEGTRANPHEPRIGTRMAVAAILPTEAGPICAISTHLESNADAAYRLRQMQVLLDAVDDFAPDLPVLIGGDLNTGNHVPPDFDWRGETLFAHAAGRGYDWSASPEGITTRASLITRHAKRRMRLDWFALRGLTGTAHPLTPPEGADGTPLSDHFAVFADLTL